MIPGEYFTSDGMIVANQNKKTIKLKVANTGDRPIQVGSHTHFSEANRALEFDREKTLGYHLNIPSGTSIRFEPGETKHVEVVEFEELGMEAIWRIEVEDFPAFTIIDHCGRDFYADLIANRVIQIKD